ncbi:hypothetical protein OBK29_09520 [Empedobacter falsenii]|uniref:hypothetical protein n=1 Tax=Empedobacter falsenii TaxID=343874 RepID=UPI003A807A19
MRKEYIYLVIFLFFNTVYSQDFNKINNLLKENNPREYLNELQIAESNNDGYFYLYTTTDGKAYKMSKIYKDDIANISFYSIRNEYYIYINCKNKRLCSYTKYYGKAASLSGANSYLPILTTDDRIANILADEIEKFYYTKNYNSDIDSKKYYTTTKDNVYVYLKPNNKSEILTKLKKGLKVLSLDETKYYIKVRLVKKNNELINGWILKSDIK